jgi:hypothetical protein
MLTPKVKTLLTKSVYGLETDPNKTPFKLINGQQKLNGIISSAGWFNGKGERLGYGDLSLKDIHRISKNIPDNEMFYVLSEVDASWDIPKELDRSAPGTDYVINNASWIIGQKLIIRSRSDIFGLRGKEDFVEKDGVFYNRLSRDEVRKLFSVADKAQKAAAEKKKEDKAKNFKELDVFFSSLAPSTKPAPVMKVKKISSLGLGAIKAAPKLKPIVKAAP